MGAVADACLQDGGRVIGVIPHALAAKELAHQGLTELRVVGSMHERKAIMADLADAFISLPGGYGTWDEFCETLTWSQLGIQHKACGLLNVNGYYDPLLAMADRAVSCSSCPHAVGRRFCPALRTAGQLYGSTGRQMDGGSAQVNTDR